MHGLHLCKFIQIPMHTCMLPPFAMLLKQAKKWNFDIFFKFYSLMIDAVHTYSPSSVIVCCFESAISIENT